MERRRRWRERRAMKVERVKKEAPARKRVNCLRERGVRRVEAVVVVVVGGGLGSVEEGMAVGVVRWRNAMGYGTRVGV